MPTARALPLRSRALAAACGGRYSSRMPELPEVEAAAALARRAVVGRAITSLRLLHPAQRRRLSARAARALGGEVVVAVERRGKLQRFRLRSGRCLEVHFRMTGDWELPATGAPLPSHARAVLEFDDGTRLVLRDPRALSVLTVRKAGASLDDTLGPDATDRAFDSAWLARALAKRRAPIKPLLLDQRIVAGVGNIYASEALWHARIDPRTPANRLTPTHLTRLVRAVRHVMSKALRRAARYYRDTNASLPDRFAVYDRERRKCRRCGEKVRRMVQAGRSTYWCVCQR